MLCLWETMFASLFNPCEAVSITECDLVNHHHRRVGMGGLRKVVMMKAVGFRVSNLS